MESRIKTKRHFLAVLQKLAASNHTGGAFFKTQSNHLAIVGFKEGDIVYLSFGGRRGVQAIPLIQDVEDASIRITKNEDAFDVCSLPTTDEIFTQLAQRFGTAPGEDAAEEEGADGLFGAGAVNQQIGEELCELLGQYVGPIAKIICEEQLEVLGRQPDSDDLRSVIQHVAKEIGEPDESREFTYRAFEKFKLNEAR